MFKNLTAFLDRGIYLAYLALTVITPLIFITKNTELFEVPKMIFVYLAAVIIATLVHLKFIIQKKHPYPTNLIFIAFVVLIATQILSAFFSIDKFTSIFGFPSRLNGGLLSLFAYLVILFGIFTMTGEKIKTLLMTSVITALAVSLWGIPGHFGYDPNCYVLIKHLTSSCWQADFDPTLRIFSTMGQPNWLASYLVLIIPISLSFVFLAQKTKERIFFAISSAIILLALIFTDSRAGLFGFVISLLVFAFLFGIKNLKKYKPVIIPLVLFILLIGFIFGQSLILRTKSALSGQSIDVGTESGRIRLIVWRGALTVFKNHPILGTGPETFAYSYYKYRPIEHNKTSEWNFFYNKAHNEFLNYLANTGILGFGAYLAFLAATLLTLLKISHSFLGVRPLIGVGPRSLETSLFAKAVLASIVGYQITIFFGFSTVSTQLLMFILIGCILVLAKEEKLKLANLKFLKSPLDTIAIAAIVIIGSLGIIYTARIYFADIYVAQAKSSSSLDRSQKLFARAINLYPTKNPFYLADSAYYFVNILKGEGDKNKISELVSAAGKNAQEAQNISNNNLLILRKVANTYLLLSPYSEKYIQKALDAANRQIELAPNDPQTFLSVAKIEAALGKTEDAKKTIAKVLELKPDYLEAQQLLDQIEAGR